MLVVTLAFGVLPARPHIGLNLIFLVPEETGGMEVYARELIPALVAAAPHLRFTAFINREAAARGSAPWGDLIPAVKIPVNARRRPEWVVGEQVLLPPWAARAGVDLMHSLASTAPMWGPFRKVVTVHDLIYARFPETHAGIRDKGMKMLVPGAARRSDRVIAISQSTRDDLVGMLGLSEAKIDVVTQGFGALRRQEQLAESAVREQLDLAERRVVLSLSAKRPHKNLLRLIDALALIAPEDRPLLVLPGYPTAHEADLRERARTRSVEGDVRLPGWISREMVEGLWALTDAFVFPSLYEGFGLPVLEAMARGVPVACSNTSSLPEVAGDAALLFDPQDESAIADALRRLLSDPALCEELSERGLARVGRFTWERTAQGTLQTYSRTLNSPSGTAST